MAQRRFWNFKDDDLTADIIRWLTGIVPHGVYFGFEFDPTADLVLNLEHTAASGFNYVDKEEAESDYQGLVITRQGTFVVEDTTIQIPGVSAGNPTNPRIDVVVLTHEYTENAGGSTALYSIIEGTPAGSPSAPALTDPLRQVKIGELYVPANMADLTDGAVVWTREGTPNFANRPAAALGATPNRALETDGSGDLVASAITATELNYLDGVTSAIQTQFSGKQATITGGATSITSANLTASRVLVSDGSGKVAVSSVTSTTLGYLDATSSIQTQINSKQATITGGASSITSSNLTASRVLVSDGSGKVAVSAVTSTTLGYLDATSSIQTQLNGKQATITGAASSITSSNLTASRVLVSDGSGKVAASSVTSTTLGYLDATSSIQTQLNSLQTQISNNDTDISGLGTDITTLEGLTNGLAHAVVNIGDWNMDSTDQVAVDFSSVCDGDQIRGVVGALIRDDFGTSIYSITYQDAGYIGAFAVGGSTVSLYRAASGYFDSTTFDATSFNRGYVIIIYDPSA